MWRTMMASLHDFIFGPSHKLVMPEPLPPDPKVEEVLSKAEETTRLANAAVVALRNDTLNGKLEELRISLTRRS